MYMASNFIDEAISYIRSHIINSNNNIVLIEKCFRVSWYTKQSSDLFKTASNDAELCTYEAINAEETIST